MTAVEPLINPYLWAVGPLAETIAPGTQVAERYRVIAPQIWLDTQPNSPLKTPTKQPKELLPYHYLYPQRLHVPVVYGLCPLETGATVLLLENVPLEGAGRLLPQLQASWSQVEASRQVYWLWQLLQLWSPLAQLGVTASLLVDSNLYVEGWLIRLRELYAGLGNDLPLGTELEHLEGRYSSENLAQPSLSDLGRCWSYWLPQLQPEIQKPIAEICQQLMGDGETVETVATNLNQLLLTLTSQAPLRLEVVGFTDKGLRHSHNEDSCYPLIEDLQNRSVAPDSQLIPHLALVCDGIGGHDGGEVASQLALRSLKLQIHALLQERQYQGNWLQPDLVMEQLAATVRVVNNLISGQNDVQSREDRRRMGTTMVLALQLPQSLPETNHPSHELYLVHVGDSRAYWITPRYCQRLTIDDDVAGREVRMGRRFYRDALQRDDANALTQALGTRSGEELHLQVQRFVLDEDGLLLLCSDGLSDYGWVEQSWGESVVSVLAQTQSLEAAAHQWLDLANQKNGHDNVSVVLMRCQVSPDYPVLPEAAPPEPAFLTPVTPAEALTEASAALLAQTATQPATPIVHQEGQQTGLAPVGDRPAAPNPWRWVFAILVVLVMVGVGIVAVRYLGTDDARPRIETDNE
jgi:serine/threonine protein phosphatase PrpC